MFAQRSKLYKFDNKLGQWKERGIGEIKIMQHNTQGGYKFSVDQSYNTQRKLRFLLPSAAAGSEIRTEFNKVT